MKKLYVFILICSSLKTFSQGIPCNPNTFWGTSGLHIEEFVISGNTVTSNGIIIVPAPPGNSLAWCNNLNGGTFSPTFYTHSSGGRAAYYDSTQWVTYNGATSTCQLTNAAGAGSYLYYNYDWDHCLESFDGASFTQIYYNPNRIFTIADLAVDDAGNAWCLMGATTPDTDSIIAISSSGQVIHQFAFSLNTNNAYGCFLMNGILYVAFGGANSTYPNSLLPITFTATAAVAGIPIPFTGTAIDLASCNAGIPLILPEDNNPGDGFTIFPSITGDYINCSLAVKGNTPVQFTIINSLGMLMYKEILRPENSKVETKINIGNFSKGVYFVVLGNGKQKGVKKFLKN